MLANVRERVTEIGLRRALGATPLDISVLFVLESCVITLSAAVVGTLLTNVLLQAGRSRIPVPLELGVVSTFVPLGAAVGLGVLFSYWPAQIAAKIAPSEALRNE